MLHSLLDSPLITRKDGLDLPRPGRTRWQPLRVGLIELFHYDAEEFWFLDGRLLLRGNNGTGNATIYTIGGSYNISKRTDFYFQTAYQHVSSGGTGTQLDDAFIPGTDNSSSTPNQVAFRFAIRHKF